MPTFRKPLWTVWNKAVYLFVLIPSFAWASETARDFTYEMNGEVVEQFTAYHRKDDYLLNPNRCLLDIAPWQNRLYGDIGLRLKYKDRTRVISKLRPTLSLNEDETGFRHIVDDLYVDRKLSDTFFIYLGKRNIRDGVALGANPTDFLGEGKEMDFTKREDERRRNREGNHLVGFDAFYHDITWTGIFAPRIRGEQEENNRILVKASLLIEPLNTDFSFHYFNARVPGMGLNLSHTASDNLVLYTETSFRKGSDKKVVRLISAGSPNRYSLDDRDNEIYPHVAAGGHYTFANGLNIIGEYIYNGDGYNPKEWEAFSDFVTYSHDQFQQGRFMDSVTLNLLQANQIIRFREMRRNYIFTRISHPSILDKIDGALVFYVNLDDGSFLVNPSGDYKINARATLGVSSNLFMGEETDEWGMMHWSEEGTFTYKYFF